METLWRSNFGKLFIGGCGTQVGMLLTCSVLSVIVVFCAVCSFSNLLSITVAQEIAGLSIEPTSPASPVAGQDMLMEEVLAVLEEKEPSQTEANTPSLETANFSTSKPVVISLGKNVNLRDGPGTGYKKIGTLPLGASMEIVGRNSESSWWLLSGPEGFAWVSNDVVSVVNAGEGIPVVTIPALLVQPNGAQAQSAASFPNILPTTGEPTPTSPVPAGTPIPGKSASRQLVKDMPSYKRLRGHLLIPPSSASISPDGSQLAITERIKLYTVTTEGALSHVWMEDNDKMGPLGSIVWSPDGKYIAFLVGYKEKYCKPCMGVALLNFETETITFLEHPGDLNLDMPRWTKDGRILVNAHPGEPADGIAYIYETSGHGEEASGFYDLSSSHEGQKQYPWLPGKTWQAGVTERADSYNSDE